MPHQRAADAAVARLGIAAHETALVVHNPETEGIAEALAGAAPRARLLAFPSTTRHGEEPPAEVAAAMRAADVVLAPTTYSLSHTRACLDARRDGTRVASLPGITADTFERAVAIDYPALERRSAWLARRLDQASSARLTTAGGTALELGLAGREGRADDGDLRAPGALGNLPAGEGYIAPLERESRGVVVFDGSLAGWGLLREPLTVEVRDGNLAAAVGGEAAAWLLDTLAAGGPGGRVLCELGIGTNAGATLCGSITEDEKVLGTAHLAFGTNDGIGGVNASSVHLDAVLLSPTLELDGERVIDSGRVLDGQEPS